MDHNFRVRKSHSLSLRSSGQEEGSHAGGKSYTNGRNIALDVLHGIVDGHACSHGTTGAVNIEMDILGRILRLQEQKLCDNQICGIIRNLLAQKNNPVLQQPGINIIAALAPSCLLYDIWNQWHSFYSSVFASPASSAASSAFAGSSFFSTSTAASATRSMAF